MANKSKTKKAIQVNESAIEDVFATYPEILASILNCKDELRLIARQLQVPSGRIDLLCVSKNKLLLVELKIVGYMNTFLTQVKGYRDDLLELQKSNELVEGNIETFLLTTDFGPYDLQACKDAGVNLIAYKPAQVLTEFYGRMAGLSNFLTIKPKDYGVWHIHVINRALYLLPEHNSIPALAKAIGNIATNELVP